MNFRLLLSVLWASFKKLQVAVTCIFWFDRYFQRSPFCGFPKHWPQVDEATMRECDKLQARGNVTAMVGPNWTPNTGSAYGFWLTRGFSAKTRWWCLRAGARCFRLRWRPFLSVFSRKELILYVMPAIRLALQVPLLGWQVKDCGANYWIWKWIRIHKVCLSISVHTTPNVL